MVKEAFLSALLASGGNPNSTDVRLVEVHQPHFDGHRIVRVSTFDAFRGAANATIVRAKPARVER